MYNPDSISTSSISIHSTSHVAEFLLDCLLECDKPEIRVRKWKGRGGGDKGCVLFIFESSQPHMESGIKRCYVY